MSATGESVNLKVNVGCGVKNGGIVIGVGVGFIGALVDTVGAGDGADEMIAVGSILGGDEMVGVAVGLIEGGDEMVGVAVGLIEGADEVVGAAVGLIEGADEVVGATVGSAVGDPIGAGVQTPQVTGQSRKTFFSIHQSTIVFLLLTQLHQLRLSSPIIQRPSLSEHVEGTKVQLLQVCGQSRSRSLDSHLVFLSPPLAHSHQLVFGLIIHLSCLSEQFELTTGAGDEDGA